MEQEIEKIAKEVTATLKMEDQNLSKKELESLKKTIKKNIRQGDRNGQSFKISEKTRSK